MSTRSLIVRKQGHLLQFAQCKYDGYDVAENLNKWVPTSKENQDYFFYKLYEMEYAEKTMEEEKQRKGSGLLTAGSTKEDTTFRCDACKDTSDWSYNNCEHDISEVMFTNTLNFDRWLNERFDFPEYVIIWKKDIRKFVSYSREEIENIFNEIKI